MATRREKLEAMLAESPDDQFLQYGLAMELDKEGQGERALGMLGQLRKAQPPHVPAFFMSAQILTRLGRISQARTALREGIEEARRQGDSHAAGEMSEYLESLGELGE